MKARHAQSSLAVRSARRTRRTAEKAVKFVLDMPQAQSVVVSGTFNNWELNATPMNKDASGWRATVSLLPGRYEYRFFVDGQWLNDPKAKETVGNDFGGTNSVVVVL